MILKVLQSDTDKWFYYDNIDLFKKKYEIRGKDQPVEENEIILLAENRQMDMNVVRCDLNFKGGSDLTIIFDEEGYLLNDEGKTIERLR